MTPGIVYLVGAGPGDPKLITVRGCELLERAGTVYYDHLVSPRLLSRVPSTATIVYVGKERGRQVMSQAAINAGLIRSAKAGRMVVRLKGGDPILFGRGGEEALALKRAGVRFEIVPGVTSALAVPAYAGIPVTHREVASSVAIVTGHEDTKTHSARLRWAELSRACDTIVCLMGVSALPSIMAQLRAHGRAATTPCAMIEWGTTTHQRTVTGTLSNIAAKARVARVKAPAVLVIGEVVRLRSQLAWFEKKPLFGRRILITRAADKSETLARELDALGAEVEQLPAIELAPVYANGSFTSALQQLPTTDWVFFTSPEGIGWFLRMLKPLRKDLRLLSGCRIAAIGPKTAAAVEAAGLHVDFIPKQFNQEGLVNALPGPLLKGRRAMILTAEASRDILEEGLRRHGASVIKVPVYRTVMPKTFASRIGALVEEPFDLVTATSASCVEHLWQALNAAKRAQIFRSLRFASIGPVTSQRVRELGGTVVVEAKTSSIEGLRDAITRTLKMRGGRRAVS